MLTAVVAILAGMAGAAAPLTDAVRVSVDNRDTRSASGFNSAIAGIGASVRAFFLIPAKLWK